MPADPLVVTLRCAGENWRYCEELRRRHFPVHLNVVPAHIALFHHLPGEELATAEIQTRGIAAARRPFSVLVTKLRSLGRGVALAVESSELLDLHRALAASFHPWLSPQDLARFAPHVTIQNKVTAAEAKELIEDLRIRFSPFAVTVLGVDVWHYRKGPWEQASYLPFGGD